MSARRTLLVGDVHGCAAELAELVERAAPDRVVLLGDLFTRGPDPAGVWRIVRELGAEAVLGNHDAWLLRHPGALPTLPGEALEWLARRPVALEGDGWVAVHAGMDPHRRVPGPLDLRRFPEPDGPYWWALWRGPPLVVHGHDARLRLNDRRPHTLGLDGGCVYGGHLWGWLAEEDRVLGVPAR